MRVECLLCCSHNCQGLNSGKIVLQDSTDLCFIIIQEHWLITEHLHQINNIINQECLSVSVSGMDSSLLHVGQPFGGCSILYRKSLYSCSTPVSVSSNRFCAIKFQDSSFLVFTCLVSIFYPPSVIILTLLVN